MSRTAQNIFFQLSDRENFFFVAYFYVSQSPSHESGPKLRPADKKIFVAYFYVTQSPVFPSRRGGPVFAPSGPKLRPADKIRMQAHR